jgi:hypothetical protein
VGHARAYGVYDSRHLVSRHAGKLETGPDSVHDKLIAMADATSMDLDADSSLAWLGCWTFFDDERRAFLLHNGCFHKPSKR